MEQTKIKGKELNMKKTLQFISTWSVPIIVAASVLCLFRFVLILGYVPSGSMEPTLKTGSLILGLRIHPELEVGDIAVFQYDGRVMVKRIAAAGGDVIEHKGEMITVPRNYYYMLGDNASDSFDSRYWDDPFIPEGDIIALILIKPYLAENSRIC